MVQLKHINKSYDEKVILEDINLSLSNGEVIALIGENGAGKTTLFEIITGNIKPDSGEVHTKNESIGYVPQEAILGKTIKESFGQNENWQIDYALNMVGMVDIDKSMLVADLSGGQKTRLAIAKILSQEDSPTTLLLDEPTNNLDAEGIVWLQIFIKNFKGSVLFTSHDRAFINNVADVILELHDGKIKQYGGNYDFYHQQKQIERRSEIELYNENIEEKNRLKKLRNQKTSMLTKTSSEKYDKIKHEDKLTFHSSKNAAQNNLGKQLKALDSRLGQIDDIQKPERIEEFKVNLLGEVSNSKLILRLNSINKSYDKVVLENINLEIRGKNRILVKGPNGSGKTTLLKIASGLIPPSSGEVQVGNNVTIGYFSQDVYGLNYEVSVLENLLSSGQPTSRIFREARSLGLNEDDMIKIPSSLSRGQQAKLAFTKMLLSPNQLLILDEPTNHLDIVAREKIEAALQNYNGAILVASHDQYFISKINVLENFSL